LNQPHIEFAIKPFHRYKSEPGKRSYQNKKQLKPKRKPLQIKLQRQ